jgi:hypothetical protein
MNLTRALWSVLNVPPMLAICLLGAVASLLAWEWLEDRCALWIDQINITRPC